MSKICKECNLKKASNGFDPNKYENWKATHESKLNDRGSVPGMELVGARRMFNHWLEKNQLWYTNLYGDGDSKSYKAVKIHMLIWK